MAELADAADSKSAEVHPSWGFNSPSRHQRLLHNVYSIEVLRALRSHGWPGQAGFRLWAPAALTPAKRLKFNSPSRHHQTNPLAPTNQSLPAGHHWTINVTGIVTGCTLELELVAVTVMVKVPAGVPGGRGGGGVEPPPQPMQSST